MAATKKTGGTRGAGGGSGARRGSAPDPIDGILAGEVPPIIWVCGESYPRDRLVAAVREKVLGDEADAFNFDTLEGATATSNAILAAARTMPMFGPARLVQVRDAHLLDAEKLNALLPYLGAPAPSNVLLFIAETADLRMKFFTQLKKVGLVHRYEALKERQAAAWVQQEAQRLKVRLLAGAAQAIAEAVGTDMGQLASAIEQLALYAGEGEPVTEDHAEQLLAQTRRRSIFELTNAVGRGDRREAMAVLRQMTAAKEPALRIVAMLSRHLRQLWSVKELGDRRASEKEIADAIGLHPYFVKDMLAQARRFELDALKRTHRLLLEVDRSLKSSKLADHLVMDRLVLGLVR